ncbi:hypothetical protein E5D57_013212 [Metarhizium anisopliae]|nr:hypothetical protein E5D57_013212 [Metarhizium anisopliae]
MASKDRCGNATCIKSADLGSLPKCSRCRKVAYCSRECQLAVWPTHKQFCVRPNYIIKFHLAPEDISEPPVTRTLSCPAHAAFYMLHMALQTAFGWATTHSFDFAVKDPEFRPYDSLAEYINLRMSISTTNERLPASASREFLFRVVDPAKHTAFSGVDRMHEGIRRHPNTPEVKADNYKLFQLFDDTQFQNLEIVYTYDFGDKWEHSLTIIGREDATRNFVCLDGSGHYVAEDVGGVRGWESLKEAYRVASPTREQKERRAWFEGQASNFDPRGLAGDRVNTWDREMINRALESGTMFERFEMMAYRHYDNAVSGREINPIVNKADQAEMLISKVGARVSLPHILESNAQSP